MHRYVFGVIVGVCLIMQCSCQAGHTRNAGARPVSSPQVVYQSPFRVFPYVTELDAITVEFSRPVTGVRPGSLRVNGSPADLVSGGGAGPYRFAGFAAPDLGPVSVEVRAASIRDEHGNPFEGDRWSYTLVDPDGDGDADGVRDGDEVHIHLTDPTRADTDGDGLPDGFETAHGCLDPLENQANPHDFEGNPLPGVDDADGDGVSDLEELRRGTDPCGG